MQSLPKIVAKRLQSPPAELHPDADLLTAFAEQSLTGAEREQVVEHLAQCGDCREVISLALPPQVESQPLAGRSVNWFRGTLLRGSALRWAAVAAGLVLIASIGTLQFRRQQGSELAVNVIQAKQAMATPARSSQPSSQAAVPQAGAREDKLAAARPQTDLAEKKAARSEGTIVLPRANSALAMHREVAGVGASGAGRGSNSFHSSILASAPQSPGPTAVAGQNPSAAPAPQTVVAGDAVRTLEAQSQTVEVTAQSAPQSQIQGQPLQNETAEQSADRVGKAKPASAQVSLAMAPPSLHSEPILMKGLPVPRWTISASGALQRSFDGGQTWQDMNVAANAPMSDFMRRAKKETTVEVAAEPRTALTSEAQSEAAPTAPSTASVNAKSVKRQSASEAPPIFRALSISSNAAEVWAGASGGVLYHTTDAGNSWTRVVPAVAGSILTGDILSIQFSDPRNGTVTTSTAEVWTTPDAGQTWHKQP
jgi:hypothetical protein